MVTFSNMSFRRPRMNTLLLFLLGLFSTWQIIQFFGLAFSTWITLLTAGYFLLTRGFDFRKDWLLIALLASTCISLVVSMVSDIPSAYKKVALTSTIQWVLIFIVCVCMRREVTDTSTSAFFRGFDWSCKIQVAWCLLQIVAYYLLDVDINAQLFGNLLNMSNETSQYRDGVLACTGLHWHAANMLPVLVYLYFRYPSFFIKGLCLVIVYFTKSATAIFSLGFAVFIDLIRFFKHTFLGKSKALPLRLAAYILLGIFAFIAVFPILMPKLFELFNYLFLRIYQIWNPSYGNESSAVHFNYYKLLPKILSNISPVNSIFGSGMNTSGHWFTVYEGQYPDMIWSVESDPVNIILGSGITGAIIHYSFLFFTAYRLLHAKKSNWFCFMICLSVSGIIYNNQFLWVILLEFMLYCQTHQASPPPSEASPPRTA